MVPHVTSLRHRSVLLAPNSSSSNSCRLAPRQQAKVHGYKHGGVFERAADALSNANKTHHVQHPQQQQLQSKTKQQDSSMQHAADSNGRPSKGKQQASSEQRNPNQSVGLGDRDQHGSNGAGGTAAKDSSDSSAGSSNSPSNSSPHGSNPRSNSSSSQHVSTLRSSQRSRGSKPKKPHSQGAAAPPAAETDRANDRKPKSSSSSSSSSSRPIASTAPATQGLSTAFPITQKQSPFYNIRLKTFQQLQHLAAVHGSSARIADITAVMSRLKHVDWTNKEDKAVLLQQLWQLLQPQLPHAAARHCAEAMLTASKLGVSPEGLYEACLQQFVAQVDHAEARILSNAIYALATAPSSSTSASTQQQVQDTLLPAFLQKLPEANSQSVANVAYALGLFGQSSSSSSSSNGTSSSSSSSSRAQLEQLLAAVKPSIWATGNSQELSNTLWVSGILDAQVPQQHLQAMISRVVQTAGKAGRASAQDISNSVYGLALLQQQQQQQQPQQLQQSPHQQSQMQQEQQQQQQLLLTEQEHQQLACAMLQKAPDPQAISGFLWATAKMGLQLQQQQVDQLIMQLLQCRPNLVPQSISLSLWAVATLELHVQQAALLQLLQHLTQADAEPQALSLSIWAAAKLEVEVPTLLLDQLYQRLAEVAEQADPQALSNALWAAAVMLPQPYVPAALLGEQTSTQQQQQSQQQKHGKKQRQQGQRQGKQQKVGQQQQHQQQQQQQAARAAVVSRVLGMKPLELSNVALALALLNVKDMQILQPVYDAAVQYLEGGSSSTSRASQGDNDTVAAPSSSSSSSSSSGSSSGRAVSDSPAYVMGPQALSNLCWAGAILDLRENADQLRAIAHACTAFAASGHVMGNEEAVQLYQLHLWLTEQLGQQGLEGAMRPQQLQHCRDSMQAVVRGGAKPSQLQHQVWEAAQLVLGLQQLQLEAATDDGLMSVDIAAVLVRLGDGAPPAAGDGVQDADDIAATTSSSTTSTSSSSSDSQQLSRAEVQQQGQQVEQKVAIEVDGPWHWRRPDRQPTGPTHFRNRLLAHRGYTVVTVPYLKWQGLREEQRVAYLQKLLHDAWVNTC